MRTYEVELNEAVSGFFEEIAAIVQRPIEELLSDTLFKHVEIISCKVSRITVIDDETL